MLNNTSLASSDRKFSLPSNSFYGNGSGTSTFNSFGMPANSKISSRTTFTQSTSRTFVEETFLKELGPVSRYRRNSNSTDSKRSLSSLPVNRKNMKVSRNRSNRSSSPDWATCRFSLPAVKKKDDYQKEGHQKENLQKVNHQKKNLQKVNHQKENLQKLNHQKENLQKVNHQKKKKHQEKEEHRNKQRKRLSILKVEENEKSKMENRHRSVSPDWNTSRFSLSSVILKSSPSSPKKRVTSPLMNRNSASRNIRSRSASPDWNTARFSLPITSVDSLKSKHKKISSVSPRISAPLANRLKIKRSQNMMYTISQKTLDKLLPKPEIHLFDVVKYGPTTPQHKDDFLFGLNLMRSEVLSKIDLLHYKKKLRNTGKNFIQTFQQPRKSRSPMKKSESVDSNDSKKVEEQKESRGEPLVSIEILDEPDEIVIEDEDVEKVDDTTEEVEATDEIDKPEEVIQINDDDDDDIEKVDTESVKLLEEAIQDFADKFGSGEIVDETTESSDVIDSKIDQANVNGNECAKETVKISDTKTFYHSVTKKHNRNSLDSNIKLFSKMSNHNLKRNSLPDIKNIKKNGIPKKKSTSIKKKNIIKIKWPIARKSLLDLRNNS